MKRQASALSGAIVAAASIATVAAFAGGLLYLDRKMGRPFIATAPSSASTAQFPADAEISRILADRIDVQKQSVGIVVGTIGPSGRNIIAHGSFGGVDPRPVDGDTVYEIGSVTKVFTALVLAEMARRGEVALNDPVAKHLPRTSPFPNATAR